MRTPKQFNNITERVIDDLKQVLSSGNSQISIAAASFSIYAYEEILWRQEEFFMHWLTKGCSCPIIEDDGLLTPLILIIVKE